jgi:MFS family permease
LQKLITMTASPKRFYRFAISVLFFILGLNFASWASRIPDVRSALHLNDAQLGLALLAAPTGNIPGLLLAGFLVGRFGSRIILTAALPLCAAVLVLLGIASSFHQLFIALLLFGFASSIFDNALNTQAVSVEKIYRRSIMSSFHGMWSLGGVGGSIFGGIMASFGASPRVHFPIIFATSVAALFLLRRWTLARELGPVKIQKGEMAMAKSPTSSSGRQLALLGIIAFCSMATEGAMYNWSSVYFQTVLHVPVACVRLGYISCMIAMVTGRFTADRFIMRFDAARVLSASGLLIAAGFFCIAMAHGIVPSMVGFSMVGLGMAVGVPISFSLAGKLANIPPSMAIATVTAISFWGFMITPPLIGFFSQMFGLRSALCAMGAMGLAIIFFAPFLKRWATAPANRGKL